MRVSIESSISHGWGGIVSFYRKREVGVHGRTNVSGGFVCSVLRRYMGFSGVGLVAFVILKRRFRRVSGSQATPAIPNKNFGA